MANASFSYRNARGRIYRYPADDKICSFWGRISGYDCKAVRKMVHKESKLIRSKWYSSTPVSWLLCPDRGLLHILKSPDPERDRQNRIPKMLRLLLDLGADIPDNFASQFAEYPFTNRDTGSSCFRILLTHTGAKEFVRQIECLATYDRVCVGTPPAGAVMGIEYISDFQRDIQKLAMRRHLYKNSKLPVEMITTVLTYI